MTKPNINSKKGFTIIEVVLVLAIAGLIFLMVFIALPNLQRTRRDTQRRNDLDRLSAALVQYVANNNKLPDYSSAGSITGSTFEAAGYAVGASATSLEKFYWKYLLAGGSDSFEDPDGGYYNILAAACESEDVTDSEGNSHARCKDEVLRSDEAGSPLNEAYDTMESFTSDGTGTVAPDSKYVMVIASQAQCGNEDNVGGIIEPVIGSRRFAVAILLEGSGLYCVDN